MTGRKFLWVRSMDRLLTDCVVGFLREQLSVWVHFLINFSHIYLWIWKYSPIWTTYAQRPLLYTCNLITILGCKITEVLLSQSDNLATRVPIIRIINWHTNPYFFFYKKQSKMTYLISKILQQINKKLMSDKSPLQNCKEPDDRPEKQDLAEQNLKQVFVHVMRRSSIYKSDFWYKTEPRMCYINKNLPDYCIKKRRI